jgi:hypothetical protein
VLVGADVEPAPDLMAAGVGRIGHSYETTRKEALRDAIAWAGTAP